MKVPWVDVVRDHLLLLLLLLGQKVQAVVVVVVQGSGGCRLRRWGQAVVPVVVGGVGPLLGLEVDPASGWGRWGALNRVPETRGVVLRGLRTSEGCTPNQGVVELALTP